MKEGILFNAGWLLWKLYHKIKFRILRRYCEWKHREQVVYVVMEYSGHFPGKVLGVFDSKDKAANFRYSLGLSMNTIQIYSQIINKGEK